jgi:ferrous iron transport protein B
VSQVSTKTGPRRAPIAPLTVKQCCHTSVDDPSAGGAIIALVGAPNVGKSTLFNALTGARVTVGNWPGTTVEVSRGTWRYQADATTCDCEQCQCETGQARQATIIDFPGAYSLDADSPDEAFTRQLVVEVPAGEAPDLVVVVVDGAHLARSLYLAAQLREHSHKMLVAVTMTDVARRHGITVDPEALSAALGIPVVLVDPRHRVGLHELTSAFLTTLAAPAPRPRARLSGAEDDDERFAWIAQACDRATHHNGQPRQQFSDKVDKVLLAPWLGPAIFLAVMWAVFQITTTVATPLQDLLGNFFAGPVSNAASWGLDQIGLGGSWVEGLLVAGLINGVGMLLSFTPLLALMFVLLALLEDSGYLARAAVLTDRVMGAIGLPGRAFLPLVVGFGCNVPAVMATRVLSTPRQRLMMVLLIPFTACTARLTVFVMLGSVFFGRWAGTAVFVMYVVSILLVVLGGLALRATLWRAMPAEPLIIDLPPYQAPTLRLTSAVAWTRLKGFLQTASGIIVATVVVVWLLQAIPVGPGGFGQVGVEDSLYAWLAQAVAPLFSPAGFGAWQTVSALVVGFVAKEAVISSWGQTYALADPNDATALGEQLRVAFEVSSGGHTLVAVAAFMVFLLAYTPCVATLAAQQREVGWKWTGFGIVVQLAVATAMSIAVFQVGRLIW